METVKINPWLEGVERLFIPRPSREENKRFDMAERTINFPPPFFDNFLHTLTQEDLITYPSYDDYEKLKEKIATPNNLQKENVFISTGSGACIKALLEITMQRGLNVISPTPSFPMYKVYGEIFGGTHKGVGYGDTRVFSLANLMKEVDNNTRLVAIPNPNSPIGDYKTTEEFRDICCYLKQRNILFLIDEAYVDFGPGTVLELIHEYDNVVISRTFSKAMGGAGIRVGYLLGAAPTIKLITKAQLTYPLSGVSVKFASFLLDHADETAQYVGHTIKSRDRLCRRLAEKGYDVITSHTNSIHFHESNGDNSNTIKRLTSRGFAFKSGDMATGTPVKIPGDDRGTWIRLSVGPNIDSLILNALGL